MSVAVWEDGGVNDADVLVRGFNEDSKAVFKVVDAAGDPVGSFPVFADIRPGGGHVELFLERQVAPGQDGATPFDYDAATRAVKVHY